MNFFSLGRIVKGLYEDKKELQSALEHMEDELTIEIEALQDENEYLKDELATLRVKDKRLEDEIKTVRERDFRDIYPGLQKENEQLLKELDENRAGVYRMYDLTRKFFCHGCENCEEGEDGPCPFENGPCPYEDYRDFMNARLGEYNEGDDEVPTETTPEDS